MLSVKQNENCEIVLKPGGTDESSGSTFRKLENIT